jgi:molybdate transport system regulatory protein
MSIQAINVRNQFKGKVKQVIRGDVVSEVDVETPWGIVTSVITTRSVDDLALKPGTDVVALVKATEVSLATGPVEGLSIRNRLAGTVREVATGAAMASVRVSVDGGELTAAITMDAVTDLGLTEGSAVTALIKSTEVSLATV